METQSLEINADELKKKLGELGDPIQFLVHRTKQQRIAMVGQLMGAYLEMTNLPPGEVELVQTEREDGSISFRFKAIEPPAYLWVISKTQADNLEDMPYIFKILAPHTRYEAVEAICVELNNTDEEYDYHMAKVPFGGFPDDLYQAQNETTHGSEDQSEDRPEGQGECGQAEGNQEG